MAKVLTTFSDYECKKETGIPLYFGKIDFKGSLSTLSGWRSTNGIYTKQYPLASDIDIKELGGTIYDTKVPYNCPFEDPEKTEYDELSNSDPTKVYNINFISVDNENQYSYALQFLLVQNGPWFWVLNLQRYNQTPWGEPKTNRETWEYTQFFSASAYLPNLTDTYSQVKCFEAKIEDVDLYVFALAVDATGKVGTDSTLVAIPKEVFANREPEERVGPVSEDAADESFAELRPFVRDELLGYDLTLINSDPFGLCGGNKSTKIVKLDPGSYLDLIDAIYTGTSSDITSAMTITDSQLAADLAKAYNQLGGRSARDIESILSAIQAIHIVPHLNIQTQSDPTYIDSIGGYALGKRVYARRLLSQITTSGSSILRRTIGPQTTSFLNYAPYTTATLVIPWCGNVSIDPSELYGVDSSGATIGGTITMEYAFDCLTGLITIYTSCEIPGLVAKHLINVSQANLATDVPISGLGGAGERAALKSISGVIGATMSAFSGNIGGIVSGTMSAIEADIDASKLSSVSNKGISSVAPYFAPTDAGLILSYPKARNSKRFAQHLGIKSNISDKIKSFKGYSEFINVNLSEVNAPQQIKEDIIRKLQEGVYIK